MITLIIIIAVVLAIISINSPDKKNEKKVQEEIQRLPKIDFKANNLTGFQKFINLAYDESSVLTEFQYEQEYVKLTMRNGKTLFAPLSKMEVHFTKNSGLIVVTVKYREDKISFYEMSKLYSNQEWEVIYRVLCLAGVTYGSDIFSSFNKNLGKVNTILKILKAIQ